MPNAPDIFRSNDVALLEISTALILNAILKHLLKWTFRVFPVKFDLQVIIVIVVVIIYFLNSSQCVKCWTLLGLLQVDWDLKRTPDSQYSLLHAAEFMNSGVQLTWGAEVTESEWETQPFEEACLIQWEFCYNEMNLLSHFLNCF